jgi:hypothetical protein
MVVWLLRFNLRREAKMRRSLRFNLEKGSKGERRMISRKNERI